MAFLLLTVTLVPETVSSPVVVFQARTSACGDPGHPGEGVGDVGPGRGSLVSHEQDVCVKGASRSCSPSRMLPVSSSPLPCYFFSSSCSNSSSPSRLSSNASPDSRNPDFGGEAQRGNPRQLMNGESKVEERCIEEKVVEVENKAPLTGVGVKRFRDAGGDPVSGDTKQEDEAGDDETGADDLGGDSSVDVTGPAGGSEGYDAVQAAQAGQADTTDSDRYWTFSNPFSALRINVGIGGRGSFGSASGVGPKKDQRFASASARDLIDQTPDQAESPGDPGSEHDVESGSPAAFVDVDIDGPIGNGERGPGMLEVERASGSRGRPVMSAVAAGVMTPSHAAALALAGGASEPAPAPATRPSTGTDGVVVGVASAMGDPGIGGGIAPRGATAFEAVERGEDEDDDNLFSEVMSEGIPQWSFPAFRSALPSAGIPGLTEDDIRARSRGFRGRGWGDESGGPEHRMEVGYASHRIPGEMGGLGRDAVLCRLAIGLLRNQPVWRSSIGRGVLLPVISAECHGHGHGPTGWIAWRFTPVTPL